MIAGICTVCEAEPELPVNESVAVPGEELAAADIVNCSGVPVETEKLLGETVMPEGGVAVTCTLPENPFTPVTEI
jgi:hypothetical protein